MMKVTAVNNGVVIDHITAGKCMKLYQFLAGRIFNQRNGCINVV